MNDTTETNEANGVISGDQPAETSEAPMQIEQADHGAGALAQPPKYAAGRARLEDAEAEAAWQEMVTKPNPGQPIETESFVFRKGLRAVGEEHIELHSCSWHRVHIPQWHLFNHYRMDVVLGEGKRQVFYTERDRIMHVDAHRKAAGVVIDAKDLGDEKPHMVGKHRWFIPYICWVTPDDMAFYAVSPDQPHDRLASEPARVAFHAYYVRSNAPRVSDYLARAHKLRVCPWPADSLLD